MSCLGSAYALQGRLAEGLVLVQEAINSGIRTGAFHNRSRRVAQLSEVCRLAECGEKAWHHACQALDLARQHKERGNEAHAETAYQQALTLATELGMRPLQAHCHHGLGKLYHHIRRAEPARAALTTAIGLYRAMDMTFWLPQAEAALAQIGKLETPSA